MNTKALLAAAVAGLLGAGLLYLYMQRYEKEVSGGAPVSVVIARQGIPLGETLTRQMIATRKLPEAYVEDRHIRASDVDRVVGIRTSNRLNANESVLWTDLATTTEQSRNLSALVRNGMRAVSFRTPGAMFGGLLRPGDRVDVFLTTRKQGGDGTTVPLLQNVLLLAVGRDLGAKDARDKASDRAYKTQVTLSVTVEQAAILYHAGELGEIFLALRNPDDIAIVEGLPETQRDDILQPEQRRRFLRRETDDEPSGPVRVE